MPSAMSFEEVYAARLGVLQRASVHLEKILTHLIEDLENDYLFRARVDNMRVKKGNSVRRKAERKGIDPKEALTQFEDLVGGRVVCNNIRDVDPIVALIRCHPEIVVRHVEDYRMTPRSDGYRAVHIIADLEVTAALTREHVTCEIQVRTFLQDAWGRLSHDDFYKPEEPRPRWLIDNMVEMAERLAVIESLAEDLRGAANSEFDKIHGLLDNTIERCLATNDHATAVTAIVESVGRGTPHQLAAIEVFLEHDALWEDGERELAPLLPILAEQVQSHMLSKMTSMSGQDIVRLKWLPDGLLRRTP